MSDFAPDPRTNLEDELLIQAYLDQELSAVEAGAFEARLAAEPLLRQSLEDWRALYGQIEMAAPPRLERDMAPVVLARLREAPLAESKLRPLLLVELLIALIVGLVAWPLWRFSALWVSSQPTISAWGRSVAADLEGFAREFDPTIYLQQVVVPLVEQLSGGWTRTLATYSLSLQYLVPLVVIGFALWLVSTRLLWQNQPLDFT